MYNVKTCHGQTVSLKYTHNIEYYAYKCNTNTYHQETVSLIYTHNIEYYISLYIHII